MYDETMHYLHYMTNIAQTILMNNN